MIQLKDIDIELADILLENVLNNQGKPSYTEVADELTKRLNRKVNAHYSLGIPLGNVSTLCFELGLPLLSARVVYSGATDVRAIGDGFHPFACQFRPEYKSMDAVAAWKNELKLIRECPNWHRLREYLDGVPILHSNIPSPVFPDERDISSGIIEGTVKAVNVNIHERNPAARQKCIEYHGTVCSVCGVDLGDIYGKEFSGKIHVHHLNPIHEYNGEHKIDPINDLRPVCPNCHMVIHCRQDKPYSIEEVREFMNNTRHDS